jgi:hypothetical protein
VGLKRERRFRRADLMAFMENQPVELAADVERSSTSQNRQQAIIAGVPVLYGTHLCALYGNDSGRVRLATAFLADGLWPKSVGYLVASPEARSQILNRFDGGRVAAQSESDSGGLIPSKYLGSPRAQWDYWETNFVDAMRAGAESLRVVGDMTSCLDAGMTLDEVVEYETGYDRMIAPRYPVVTMCMYDVRQFESLEVVRALKGHADTFRYPAERLLA